MLKRHQIMKCKDQLQEQPLLEIFPHITSVSVYYLLQKLVWTLAKHFQFILGPLKTIVQILRSVTKVSGIPILTFSGINYFSLIGHYLEVKKNLQGRQNLKLHLIANWSTNSKSFHELKTYNYTVKFEHSITILT